MNSDLLTTAAPLTKEMRADDETIARHVANIRTTVEVEDKILNEATEKRNKAVATALAEARMSGVPMDEIEAAYGKTRQAVYYLIKKWFRTNTEEST